MSIIHTAELAKIEVFGYLVALQRQHERIAEDPAAWMPWNYTTTLARSLGPLPRSSFALWSTDKQAGHRSSRSARARQWHVAMSQLLVGASIWARSPRVRGWPGSVVSRLPAASQSRADADELGDRGVAHRRGGCARPQDACLQPEDLRRKVAVLGRDVRRALFSEDESALGCIISVDSSPYRVVGTFDEVGDGSEQQIYIPLPTAQALHTGFSPQELWALFELGAQVTLETLVLCGVSGYAGLVVVSGIGSDALPRTPRSP